MLDEQGAALLNKCLAFRTGSGISTIMINRTIEDAGGVPFATADRTKATLGYTVTPENSVALVPLLAVDCSMEKWDLREAKNQAGVEVESAAESAQIVLTENLCAAAYGPQSPAGRPFYFSDVSTDEIKSFRARAYGLGGAVLTATGVKDHSLFCSEVGELLSGAPAGTSAFPAPMTYLGGESRVAAPSSGYAHIALAFKAPTSSVVARILKQVINISGMKSGLAGFAGAGTVGAYAGGSSPGSLVDEMCKALTAAVTADVVRRAKGLAKAEALFALDGGSKSLADAMTAAVMESGKFMGPTEVAKSYDAVTESQVKDAMTAMLKTNASLAAVGDIASVPYHATVAARFK